MTGYHRPIRTRPEGCGAPPSRVYDTALLDLDGVVYAGGEAVVHAVESLAAARETGMRLAYVTNNAARTPETVAGHLTRLGVPAEPGEVVTSAQAVARMISEELPAGSRVLCVGAEGLRVALRERGLEPVESADDAPAAVVQGYGGPEMPWGRLSEAAIAVGRGLPWFASNGDLTIPSGRGIAPGNGAAVEVVRIATRWMRPAPEPRTAGKPLPPMHRETILRTGAQRPLVVGDRLDTDIEGAYAGGVDSLLVLTGVTDAAQLLAAPPEHRPTYVAADLRALHRAQPEVEELRGGGRSGFLCGGWTASAEDGSLRLEGRGDDPLDGLRALCAVAWTQAGEGVCRAGADGALAALGL
ncbi:HAD hydrolase-like protein [Streptomyces pini]|uniref:Haloacid Dehalogenase Superfamily Class (Subfamily) IIA n=1 Tax=Streptomyces pini TaxID=1520580 RepID=A0A1I4HSD1_9ACTN|nr:HAD hydrolase-like protein [Streptomyces pini]SFL44471.1 Haloacid Dehalogenase Superfamily Class (subfamily) IIA [Streptomyces pini]